MTEFDEQVKKAIKVNLIKRTLVEKYRQFKQGLETMGVLSGYEMAAIRQGISLDTIEKWYKENLLY